jgi:molybdate transport system regulatory protein
VENETGTSASALRLLAGQDGKRSKGRIELLEKIAETGSISAAARALGLSYKAAWEAVDAMNNLSHAPLLERVAGGRQGGGTVLTERGREVVQAFGRMEAVYGEFLAALKGKEDLEPFLNSLWRSNMQTSARNQFLGRVVSVKIGAVNAEVILDIGGGDQLAAIITNESVENLALKPGVEAYALIKAPWVILTTDDSLKTSARNRLCGTVVRCQEGAVNGEVILELPGGKTVAAIITNASIQSLGLKEGVRACALIKASHIILAVAA